MKKLELKKTSSQKIVFLLILILGTLYLSYTWIRHRDNQIEEIVQLAQSIESTLPKEDLETLKANPSYIDSPQYRNIKNTLEITANTISNVTSASIFTEQNGKAQLLTGSKPKNPKNLPPLEQKQKKLDLTPELSFNKGKKFTVKTIPNYWGTLQSVHIPVEEETTGITIALFVLEFDAGALEKILIMKLIEPSVLIFLLLLVSLFLFRIKSKNKTLKHINYECKALQQTLLKSEEKYRGFFENIQDVFYQTDLSGNFLEISPSFEHFTQLSRDEVRNTKVGDFYSNPNDRQLMLDSILEKGELRDYQIKLRMRTGIIKYASINARLIYDTNGNPNHIDGALRDITERIQAKKELTESEYRLRTIIETEPECIKIVDAKGRLLLMNPAGLEMIQADSLEQVTGQPIINIIAPEYRRTFARMHQRVLAGQSMKIEFQILGLKGRRIWLETHAVPMQYHGKVVHLAHTRNITERKQVEEKLKENEMFLKETQIIAQLGTYVLNIKDGTWTSSDILNRLLGLNSCNEKLTQSWASVIHPEWQQLVENYFKNEVIDRKCKFDQEFKIIRENDQEERWVHGLGEILYNEANFPIKMIGTIQDITEHKRIEKELILAKEKAEESDRLKSAFLANMSHEIRTPMNGILGFSELLKEPNLPGEEQLEYIDIIQKSGIRMLNIINDIIDISKIESGLMKVSISETNINKQMEYIYTFFKPEVDGKGIQLSYKNTLPLNEALIKTDPEKIYAVLTNLVKNAIKFTSKGTIEFGYNLKSVKPKTACKSGYLFEPYELEFFVKDSGSGIHQEHLEMVFERFRQSSESLTRDYEGAGLGLSISKAYIEMLGGQIWVESELGKGAIFYFTIPYNGMQATKKVVKNHDQIDTIHRQINNLKILIAEDDNISARLLTLTMKNDCKEILRARNGAEAIEICRNNPDIDLIFMDIQMPQMDGYQTTKLIREFNKDVIIIAQTAYALTSDRTKTLAAGCNDYISKPVKKVDLLDLLQKYFKKTNTLKTIYQRPN